MRVLEQSLQSRGPIGMSDSNILENAPYTSERRLFGLRQTMCSVSDDLRRSWRDIMCGAILGIPPYESQPNNCRRLLIIVIPVEFISSNPLTYGRVALSFPTSRLAEACSNVVEAVQPRVCAVFHSSNIAIPAQA